MYRSNGSAGVVLGRVFRAVYLASYPVGEVCYQNVDFDPVRFRVDPEGYLDAVECQLPQGAFLVRVEESPRDGRS